MNSPNNIGQLPDGVHTQVLPTHRDQRGELSELFRMDEIQQYLLSPTGHTPLMPVMAYASVTNPGVLRGPHEHALQTDIFVFFGKFHLWVWDNRPQSPTVGARAKIEIRTPARVIVPPGVVHGYRCVDDEPAVSLNFPNVLYAGWNKEHAVDETRHENDPESPFQVW